MLANRSRPSGGRRPGLGLVEMVVTVALLAVAMTATVQVVGWVALERRSVDRRERALGEARNLLERLAARPWDDLTPEAAARVRPSDASAHFLGKPTLTVTITPADDAPARKKLAVELRWPDRSGRPEAPVRLIAWVYRREGGGR